jgi:tetratricopeptide (TPR) repeat protein
VDITDYVVPLSPNDAKKQPPFLKAKDKFLNDIFGDLNIIHNRTAINNFWLTNKVKWKEMTCYIRDILIEDKIAFQRFQNFMIRYRSKYESDYIEIFNNRKEILLDRYAFYFDDCDAINQQQSLDGNKKLLNKSLQDVIQRLSEINDETAFMYMVYLLMLISIFHETLVSDKQLEYLYDEKYISKFVPGILNAKQKKEKTDRILLSSPKPIAKKIFGRDKVIDDIAEKLKDDHVLFLQGVGGIGKTEIGKNFIKKHSDNYDIVIWGTYTDSLASLLISNTFEFEPKISRKTLPDGSKETDNAFAMRKLQKIKSFSNERTLIVIDNFDTLEDDLLPELIDGRYHILCTTRCDYSEFYPSIQIQELNDIALKELFYHYYGDIVSDENDALLLELFKLLGRHTYTIELVAKQMANSGETVGEFIESLKKQGLSSLNERVRTNGSFVDIGYNTILNLFRIFSLNEEEKKILAYLSLMPLTGISKSDLKRWAGLRSLQKTNELIQRSLIQETENKKITLHPIIKDIIAHEYPPEKTSAKEFFLNILKDVSDFKYRNMSMNKIHYYADIFECHSHTDTLVNYNDVFHSVCYVLNHAQRYECSLSFAEKCLEMSKVFSGEKSAYTAKWYFRMSELHNLFNNKDIEANLLEKASSILENYTTDIDAIYVSIRLATTKNSQEASRLLQKSLEDLNPLMDQQGVLIPNGHIMQLELYNQLSKLYFEKIQDYDRALSFAVSAKDTLPELSFPSDYALFAWEARIFSTLALAYSKTDNDKLALSTAQQALESAKKCYGDENHFLSMKCKFDLCRIYSNLNMHKEALILLETLKNTLQAKGDFETLLSNVTTMIDEIKNQSS